MQDITNTNTYPTPNNSEKLGIIKMAMFDIIFFQEDTICEALLNNYLDYNNIEETDLNFSKIRFWFKEIDEYMLKNSLLEHYPFWSLNIIGRIKRIIFLYKMFKNYV